MDTVMDTNAIKGEIQQLDIKMLEVFNERMEWLKKLTETGAADEYALGFRTRQRETMAYLSETGNLDKYGHRLFRSLFDIECSYRDSNVHLGSKVRSKVSKAIASNETALPETGTIACQGVEGAYSSLAADAIFPRGNVMFLKTFEAVFDAVGSGLSDFGILPIENSSNGSVREVYDLLQTKDVCIVKSLRLCIRHELLAKPGVELGDITEIYSHEQAIGQCSAFLKSLPASVKVIPCENTALAAKMASDSGEKGAASISSHSCGTLYGLIPINTNIQDSDNNYTRFICIKKQPVIYPGSDRISLIISLKHQPGSLSDTLQKFATLGINLLKLESCPVLSSDFEFIFFFELRARATDDETLCVLEELERESESFHFLGCYSEI